jgi:hypothetical protein
VQLGESPIVGMHGSIENEGLRDRCATMPASFEKYRARAVARGLLDEGDFLRGRPAGIAIDSDQAIDGGQPPRPIAKSQRLRMQRRVCGASHPPPRTEGGWKGERHHDHFCRFFFESAKPSFSRSVIVRPRSP